MKYFGTVFLTLLIAIGLITGVYYYFHGYNQPSEDDLTLTTATSRAVTQSSDKIFLAEHTKGDFKLFAKGSKVILEHDGKSNEFTGWSEYIAVEKPKLYYADFNADDKKELAIKLVSGIDNATGKELYYYDLYILSPKKQSDGSYEYDIVVASRDTWKKQFNEYVKCDVSQLKKDKSRVQVVMGNANDSLSYDPQTGISTSKYVGYSRAARDSSGAYMKVYKWDLGIGEYTIDGNDIGVDIAIRVAYNVGNNIKVIGYVHCGLELRGSSFSIQKNSVYYHAADEYRVTDPRDTAKSNWSYTVNNIAGPASSTDLNINWVSGSFKVPASGKQSDLSFQTMESEIKSVDSVQVTAQKIVLTAKAGYAFANNGLSSRDYSVTIVQDKTEYQISDSAEITEKNGRSVLTITLDKKYKREALSSFTVKYGA